MGAQAPGTVVNAGGPKSLQPKIEKMCKAFVAAVTKYCKKSVKGKKFNDFLMKELQKEESTLAGQIKREVPVLFKGGLSKGGAVVGTLAAGFTGVAGARNGAAAEDVWDALAAGFKDKGMTGADDIYKGTKSLGESLRAGLLNKGGQADGYYRRFLDGEINANGKPVPIEIKGPGDSYHDTQAKDMAKLAGKDGYVELSCETCTAPCKSDGGKKSGCKKPKAK